MVDVSSLEPTPDNRPQDPQESLELFSVRRLPAPPDVPSRVVIALRDADDEDARRQDGVRGPGPGRRTTSGPQDAQAPAWWWREARTVVLNVVNAGGTICSDDLHDAFPTEPSATGSAIGGLFARLAHEGLIVEVGMVKSRRPEARRRRIITWGRP